jgi:hypothetical protein
MAGRRHGVRNGEKSISVMELKQGVGIRGCHNVPHPKNLYSLHLGGGRHLPPLRISGGRKIKIEEKEIYYILIYGGA